jgi:hypothetical protein
MFELKVSTWDCRGCGGCSVFPEKTQLAFAKAVCPTGSIVTRANNAGAEEQTFEVCPKCSKHTVSFCSGCRKEPLSSEASPAQMGRHIYKICPSCELMSRDGLSRSAEAQLPEV